MKRLLTTVALVAVGLGLALAQPAKKQEAAPASVAKYESIWRRNIFDPNRTPRAASRTDRGPAAPPPPAEDRLRLAGTMVADGPGSAAFVSEGSSRAVKLLRPGDEIKGLKIGRIGTQMIEATEGTTKLSWPVGKEILRAPGEGWRVPGTASPEEIMARLRKRRLQESGQ